MQINDEQKAVFADRFRAFTARFKRLKEAEKEIETGSLHRTMERLQACTNIKKHMLKELNELHFIALHLMNRIQYVKFQEIVKTIKRDL